MKINGIEFPFDPLNAKDVERVEEAQRLAMEADAEEKAKGNQTVPDVLRGQCRVVMVFIDCMLGEGASEKLGLDGNDLRACRRVSEDIQNAVLAEQKSVGIILSGKAAPPPSNQGKTRRHKRKRR